MASTRNGPLPNAEVARLLHEISDLLELDQASPYRIRAYRSAAHTIDGLAEPISVVDARPETALENLPGIGAALARTIRRLTVTGSVALLDRLRARYSADELDLARIRGIGPKRIRALESALRVRSIPALRRALDDQLVRTVPGFGVRSEARFRAELAAIEGRSRDN